MTIQWNKWGTIKEVIISHLIFMTYKTTLIEYLSDLQFMFLHDITSIPRTWNKLKNNITVFHFAMLHAHKSSMASKYANLFSILEGSFQSFNVKHKQMKNKVI
jgi:hypothetical protein